MRDSLPCLNLNIYHDSAYIWWINWYFVCSTCRLAWNVWLVKATIQQPTGRWLRCDVVTRMWEIFFGSESKPSPLIIIPVLDLRPQKLRYTVLDAWFEPTSISIPLKISNKKIIQTFYTLNLLSLQFCIINLFFLFLNYTFSTELCVKQGLMLVKYTSHPAVMQCRLFCGGSIRWSST